MQVSFTKAFVSGEAFLPSMREAFAARGMVGRQAYATADIGLIAYETRRARAWWRDEDILLEIVRPGTGDPVAPGEVGEVVVTTFNPDHPLIRFGTGDPPRYCPAPSGRTNLRIWGLDGTRRPDHQVKACSCIRDRSRRWCAATPRSPRAPGGRQPRAQRSHDADVRGRRRQREALAGAVAASIRELTKLRGEVAFLPTGALANDGKVIDDVRTYA